MSDEVTTHQVKGICEAVMMRGDWQEYHINIGRQHPVKLSTKQEDVKLLAAAAGQAEAVWTYTERDGNPNPHQPGKFYKNRYLSNVVVGGELDPNLAAPPAAQQSGGGQRSGGSPSPEGRETSIERQVLVKAVIGLYPAGLLTTDDEWWTLLERLDTWMAHDRKSNAPAAEAVPDAVAEQQAAAVDPDDDIPF